MTRPTPPWRYAPHPRLATIVLLLAWAIVVPGLGLLLLGVTFSGPWDPDDLTGADWLAQAAEYRRVREVVLAALAPIALAALAATVGALVRRWWAPLVFAVPVWCAVALVGFSATAGLEGSITTALERAAAPEAVVAPAPTPTPPPPLTEAEAMSAVRTGIARSFAASHPPVVFVDGVPVADTDVPITVSACADGGVAAWADVQFSTADNVASEEAILDAFTRNGYARDRAAGTNLLYGAGDDPVERVTLRGLPSGLLHLTVESRCALG